MWTFHYHGNDIKYWYFLIKYTYIRRILYISYSISEAFNAIKTTSISCDSQEDKHYKFWKADILQPNETINTKFNRLFANTFMFIIFLYILMIVNNPSAAYVCLPRISSIRGIVEIHTSLYIYYISFREPTINESSWK